MARKNEQASRRNWVLPLFVLLLLQDFPLSLAAEPLSGVGLDELIRQFDAERDRVHRFFDLPWSEARVLRLERFTRDWQEKLRGTDFSKLSGAGRIDYLLLRNELASDLNQLAIDSRRLNSVGKLLPGREGVQHLEQARWKLESLDLESSASTVGKIPEQIKLVRERIERALKDAKTKKQAAQPATEKPVASRDADGLEVSPELALQTAGAVDALRESLKTWYSYYEGYLPEFSWWLKKPYEEAGKVFEDYAKFLREEVAGLKGKDEDPLLGEPVGAEELGRQIGWQFLPYTADELIRIGELQMTWCEAELQKAAKEMGCGADWKAALKRVKENHSPPGRQDLVVAECAREAIRFVKEKEMVTVPPLCEETWRVSMLSADSQKTIPYVAYGGQNILVAFAREEMKQDDKLMSMRGNNRSFTRITTAHELIPGHHLQRWASSQHHAYRSMFTTPFFVEGWALYCELMLWEHGYGRTPEERIGMLFWRMHRCARIVVSLNFHLGRMKPQEMVDFLVNRVGHEQLGATAEVRRSIGYGYGALYQAAYMIGGLQLKALHDELVRPGEMSERQFNDTVLTFNAIPIELIRAGMRNLPLSADSTSTWRFAGDLGSR